MENKAAADPKNLTTGMAQPTAVALITGTPKSEVHKVNQRKLISVLEVRGCNKGSSRLLQNQKSNQLPQRKQVRAFRMLAMNSHHRLYVIEVNIYELLVSGEESSFRDC